MSLTTFLVAIAYVVTPKPNPAYIAGVQAGAAFAKSSK